MLFHENRFDIDKFPDAVVGEFAAVAAFFDTAEGQAGIGTNKGVHKTTASL